MSLSIGIVGLPNVGKSTLFNALTKNDILAANYPFATIEPNTGIVPVPDERLKKLSELYSNAPIVPATVTFVDIAGLVAGASKGEGLGNQFLANIRECSAIVHIVRAFENNDIVHVHDRIHPKQDIEIINTELMLADLQTIEKTLPRFTKEAKTDPKMKPLVDLLLRVQEILLAGNLAALADLLNNLDPTSEAGMTFRGLQLITTKPVIYVFNINEEDLSNKEKQDELCALVAPAQSLFVNAQLEAELKDLPEDDAKELLESYGQNESGLNKVINAAYKTLGLQSYLTSGGTEVRAWTIKEGSTAPQAAGVIHGDFERGFIAAEVVTCHDLLEAGSLTAAKSAGKVRTEGKTYIMQPDDVVEFRFNV
ncbi:MAG: ribosome-binding ATPase [Patescibacteria group bacterium]|nr:ribosome-binding ATPase [Patescibacteria group bacterium]